MHLLLQPPPLPDPAPSAEVAIHAPPAWRVPEALSLSEVRERLSAATPLLTTDPKAAREILTALPSTDNPNTLTMDS